MKKVGDVVRIAYQPSNQCANLVGMVGYIDELNGDMANVQTFEIDGRTSGMGTVPLSCLVHEPLEVWHRAKAKLDAVRAEHGRQHLARQKRWDSFVRGIAKKHGIRTKAVREIWAALRGWEDEE